MKIKVFTVNLKIEWVRLPKTIDATNPTPANVYIVPIMINGLKEKKIFKNVSTVKKTSCNRGSY